MYIVDRILWVCSRIASVLWHTYLSGGIIILRTAPKPWGSWSNAVRIAPRSEYPICYGTFMNKRYVSEDGCKIVFLMSMWAPVYNTVVMEMELVSKEDAVQ